MGFSDALAVFLPLFVLNSSYDSGSPIIIPGRKHDLLVGLVSWGEECGDPDFPGE